MSAARLDPAERALLAALRGLEFGTVEAVVHEGRIVRIERTEKLRLESDPKPGGSRAPEAVTPRPRPERRSPPDVPERGDT